MLSPNPDHVTGRHTQRPDAWRSFGEVAHKVVAIAGLAMRVRAAIKHAHRPRPIGRSAPKWRRR
jgi:hypothetical protein